MTTRARMMLILGLSTLILLRSKAAFSLEFRDAATGFRIGLDIPGAMVCVLKPATLQDAAACKGLNVAAATTTISPETNLTAIIRHPGAWGAALVLTIQPKPRSGPMTKADAREFVEGALETMRQENNKAVSLKELQPGVAIDTQIVNGLQMFHYQFEAPTDPKTGMGSFLNYVVVGRKQLILIEFFTGPKKRPLLVPVAESLLKTVSMPTASASPTWK